MRWWPLTGLMYASIDGNKIKMCVIFSLFLPLFFSLFSLLSFFCQFAGIYFHIIGYGKCSWTDLLRRESVAVDGKGERSAIKYSGTEEYLNSTMYIVGSKNGNNCTLANRTNHHQFVTICSLAIYFCFIFNIVIELNSWIAHFFSYILLILIEPSV